MYVYICVVGYVWRHVVMWSKDNILSSSIRGVIRLGGKYLYLISLAHINRVSYRH